MCWWVGVFPSVGEKGKGIVAYEILSFSEHSAEQDEHGEQLTFREIDAAPPVASFAATPTNGLAPLTVQFTNSSTSATSYAWNFGDGKTSTATNPSNTYTNAGTFTVTLTATGSGGTNVLIRNSYIVATNNPPPVANFAASPTNGVAPLTVSFTNLSANASSYNWNFGDGNSSTATNASNIYSNPGTYSLTLTAVGLGGTNTLTRTNYVVVLYPALINISKAFGH